MTSSSEDDTLTPQTTPAESWRGMAEACLDFTREARKGVPEVVYAGVKSDEQVIAIVRAFLDRTGHAVVSRLRARAAERLRREFADCAVDLRRTARAAAIHAPGYTRPHTGGQIGTPVRLPAHEAARSTPCSTRVG